jgi:hypothetical protein
LGAESIAAFLPGIDAPRKAFKWKMEIFSESSLTAGYFWGIRPENRMPQFYAKNEGRPS